MAYDPPLSGIEIVDLTAGPITAVGRLLADLGAHVTAVHLAGVTAADTTGPRIDGVPIGTAINRHGLPTVEIDTSTPGGRQAWADLVATADILIENTRPGSAAEKSLSVKQIHADHPALVILSISDFGRDTRYRDWQATTPVLHALTSELSRSGIPGQTPLVPPSADLPYHVAAAQAAFFALCVFLDRLRTGTGDLIDFSVLEGRCRPSTRHSARRAARRRACPSANRSATGSPSSSATRSSNARTATSACACWQNASGRACSSGWDGPRNSPTRSSTASVSVSRPRLSSAPSSSSVPTRPALSWNWPDNATVCRRPRY